MPQIELNPRITESRLFLFAASFLIFAAASLTLAPIAKYQDWGADLRWSHWAVIPIWLAGFGFTLKHARKRLPGHDPFLIPVIGLLSGWGLLAIWRLSSGFGLRQLIWMAAGLAIINLGIMATPTLVALKRYKYLWLLLGIGLTAATLVFGVNPDANGQQLWLGCCGVYVQPSEILKIILIVFLAGYMSGLAPLAKNILALLLPIGFIGVLAVGVLILQRDLGTALVYLAILVTMIFLATQDRKFLAFSLVGFAGIAIGGYFFFDIVGIRFSIWLDPFMDASGKGFQIVQGLISMASGGIIGTGPGLGRPDLVPVSLSDFIYTAIVEEYGLVGGIGILLLYAILLMRGIKITLESAQTFHKYLAGGITTYLVAQAILIIGGNLRLNPLTGVTLPFVSYGGSSFLTACTGAVILVLISSTPERRVPLEPETQKTILDLGLILGAGLVACSLFLGMWTIVREDELTYRSDNFRLPLGDLYSPRGNFFDRNNQALTHTQGKPGSLERQYLYPGLAHTLGYSTLNQGQAGLEAWLDVYLRGYEGMEPWDLAWHELAFGYHAPGRDVKLTLDIEIQNTVDRLMGTHTGAVVLMNARSGEILALGSYPGFDPNNLEENWAVLLSAEQAPLVNRAVQGQYPPGTALASLLYAYTRTEIGIPQLPSNQFLRANNRQLICAGDPGEFTWESAMMHGCPGPVGLLGAILGQETMLNFYNLLGLEEHPNIGLPYPPETETISPISPELLAVGYNIPPVSPLQIARAASMLSAGGVMPYPKLILGVDVYKEGWKNLQTSPPSTSVLNSNGATATANELIPRGSAFWMTTAYGYNILPASENSYPEKVTWFLGGTLPGWQGEPVVAVVVLEEDDPVFALNVGRQMLEAVILPTGNLSQANP